jgi:putative MATE family efflux protein
VSTLAAAAMTPVQRMLHAPLVLTIVIGYDGFILGRLGAGALAGVALVLPLSMLMLQMSAGGLGGAATAAVARALGAGNNDDATRLAQHALVIATAAGALFTLALVFGGRVVYTAMGGRDAALADALAYSGVIFGGAVAVWLNNVLAAVVRGTGNMLLPSLALLGMAAVHIVLCPLLAFGSGQLPGLGVAGAAASTVIVNVLSAAAMAAVLLRPGALAGLRSVPWKWQPRFAREILRVGLPASLNPVLSNTSIAISTALVGTFGTVALAGYGIAARLEYILVPIAFGFGTALTAMVATNMGAGQAPRALRVAWTGSALVAVITGTIGVVAAAMPALWMNLFTTDIAVRGFGASYLNIVGACYAFFGLGLALFFASQGAGRMSWPLVASSARVVVVAAGGWFAVHALHGTAPTLFIVIAASFIAYATTLALAIRLGGWSR